jgi:hypothetical protein
VSAAEVVHLPGCNARCGPRSHWLLPSGPAGEPFSHQAPSLLALPDGTTHEPVPWDHLVPYERDQGGYWLYGPWCDVYGNGKVFVRVPRPAVAA